MLERASSSEELNRCEVLNVRSALPSEQDKCEGQEELGEREITGKALVPYISPTTHGVILARAEEYHIAPSTGNKKHDFQLALHLSHLDRVHSFGKCGSWSVPNVPRSLRRRRQRVHFSTWSVRVTFTHGAFTPNLTALAPVIPWDVVVDVLQCMIAGFFCCGILQRLVSNLWRSLDCAGCCRAYVR